MNNKEKYLHKILDAVVESCSYICGCNLSITKEDVLGKSRNENVVMTRCIAVAMMIQVGFSITTCAGLFGRTTPAIRHMIQLDRQFEQTSMVYRIANRQATEVCTLAATRAVVRFVVFAVCLCTIGLRTRAGIGGAAAL